MRIIPDLFHRWRDFEVDEKALAYFKSEIDYRNIRVLRDFSLIYAITNLLLFFVELIWGGSTSSLCIMAFTFVFFFYFFFRFQNNVIYDIPPKNTPTYTTVLLGVSYAIAIWWSTARVPQDYGVIMPCALILIPCMVNENPLKTVAMSIVAVVLFSMTSFFVKIPYYATADTIHAIIFATAGFFISNIKNAQTIEELVTKVKLQKANAKLKYVNTVDPLTTIYNRGKIFEVLEELTEKNRNENKSIACAILDLDDFKIINDTYGHPQGDVVLRSTGSIITNVTKSIENVSAGRIGGEEFMLLAYDMPVEEFAQICEKINREVHRITLSKHDNTPETHVSISCGLCVMTEGSTLNIYSYADKALYQAKHKGKNCIWKYRVKENDFVEYKLKEK